MEKGSIPNLWPHCHVMIQKNQNIQASGKCLTLGGLVYQLNVPAAVQVSGGVAIPLIQAGKCDDKQHLDNGLS